MKEWMARRYKGKLLYIVRIEPISVIKKSTEYKTVSIIIDQTGLGLKSGEAGEADTKLILTSRELVDFIFSGQNSKDR